MSSFIDKLRNGWNAFIGRDPTKYAVGHSSFYRPDRYYPIGVSAKNLVNVIYNKIAVDVSLINFKHVRIDDQDRYTETLKTSLNTRLTLSANKDQTGRDLIRDIVMSMITEGTVAVVPIDTDDDVDQTDQFKIESLRTGKIIEWYPDAVKVHVYNDATGRYQDLTVPKRSTVIIENPYYYTMNEPNSTLQQLMRTINQLNRMNSKFGSDKLDLIIQLPYSLKGDLRIEQAKKRKEELEEQLVNSRFGIGYIDASEHVTQLNRSLENNLWEQVKELTSQLYSQLGIPPSVIDGTATADAIYQYQNSTLIPICNAISEEMTRKWITPTAFTQGQRIMFFRDLFKLISIDKMGELAEKLTGNAITKPNEFRTMALGLPPSDEPAAEELRNPKINKSDAEIAEEKGKVPEDVNESKKET